MSYPFAGPQYRNGLGIAGMVLGIIGLCFFVAFYIALPCSITGLVLSVQGRKRIERGAAINRAQTTAGIVCNTIAIILATIVLVFVMVAASYSYWSF